MTEFIDLMKEIGLPLVLAILAFFGGRKSGVEKKKLDFESIKIEFDTELNALKEFRTLLISDNNSLKDELKQMRVENKELKGLVSSLQQKCGELTNELQRVSNLMCSNAITCVNKK